MREKERTFCAAATALGVGWFAVRSRPPRIIYFIMNKFALCIPEIVCVCRPEKRNDDDDDSVFSRFIIYLFFIFSSNSKSGFLFLFFASSVRTLVAIRRASPGSGF